ncbi:vegetative incompatibility protein het-e-1 [Moniliophthora roreri]|nr:vegetative incompatibility protein het-e-1 [Moniliophthora roreri]
MFNGSSQFSITGGDFVVARGYHEHTHIYTYNSGERVSTAPRCTPGTREAVIRLIMKWTTNPFTPQRILWLNGLAGEGKSAIAQSFAEICASPPLPRLAASFFFSRAHAERSSAMRLFPTIAYQLTTHDPRLKHAVLQALQKDSSIPDLSPKEQLERLIVQPIMSLREPVTGACPTRIIIIEALDECDDYMSILECLTTTLILRPHLFKLIVTSRPESEIQEFFSQSTHSSLVQSLVLSQFDARADIRLYLESSFDSIRKRHRRRMNTVQPSEEWPPRAVVDRLVHESAGLFIYAASIIHYVDHWFDGPARRLSMLIDGDLSAGSFNNDFDYPYGQLDRLYKHILGSVQDYSSILRTVLGTVMSLYIPLSRQDLSLLLSPLLHADQVTAILDRLSPILKIPWNIDSPEPIQIYHQSLRDFLADRRRSEGFYVDPLIQHADITECCFQLMRRMLKRDISVHSWTPGGTYSNRMDVSVLGALRYACRFWAQHLNMSPLEPNEVDDYLEEFIHNHFLSWIECMSLLGELGRAIQSLGMFVSNEKYREPLRECETFILAFYYQLATSAKAVYTDALPSCPLSSPLRKWYRHMLPSVNRDNAEIATSWRQILKKTAKERTRRYRVKGGRFRSTLSQGGMPVHSGASVGSSSNTRTGASVWTSPY